MTRYVSSGLGLRKDNSQQDIASSSSMVKTIAAGSSSPQTYYFSASGNDANSGLTPATAKQTVTTGFAGISQVAGDTYLFNGGDTFVCTPINGVFPAVANVTVSSYGTGRPTFTMATDGTCVYTEKSGCTFSNLIASGPGTGTSTTFGIGMFAQTGTTITGTISGCKSTGFKQGIYIGGVDANTINSCTITANECSSNTDGIGVGGNMILYGGSGNNVTNNYCHDNLTNGIFYGYLQNGTISGNFLSTNGGNSAYQGPCGLIVYKCDGITISGNEAYNTKTSVTQGDGMGIDVESASNIIVQYNYTHSNDAAGLQIYNFSSTSSAITFRYNISINDAKVAAPASALEVGTGAGSTSGVYIYGNTIYQSNAGKYIFTTVTDTAATGFLSSNIFYTTANQMVSSATALTINKNTVYGGTSFGTNAQTSDPLLTSISEPTVGWLGNLATALAGFKLLANSPAINAGEDIASVYGRTLPSVDFFGATIGAVPINQGASDTVPTSTSYWGGGNVIPYPANWNKKQRKQAKKEAKQAKKEAKALGLLDKSSGLFAPAAVAEARTLVEALQPDAVDHLEQIIKARNEREMQRLLKELTDLLDEMSDEEALLTILRSL